MNIYIEVFSINHPYVGVGEFCLNLGQHLAKRSRQLREQYGIELYFIVPKGKEGIWGNDVHYVSYPGNLAFLPRILYRHIDLLHLPHQYCHYKHFLHVGKTLTTIHDINFMYEKQGKKLEKYKKKFIRKLHQADYVSFISQFTKNDTLSNFTVSSPYKVIYNGVTKTDADSIRVSEAFVRQLPDRPFLFHISSLRPKKNVHLLIEMMAYLPQETLVIAGDWSGRYGREMQGRISELKLTNIVCLDNVSADEKIWLYDHCRAFLFPSVCEGFGLPPVEAMYYGKPVFLSTLTSLPEVGGEWAFYWEHLTPEEMAGQVRRQLADFDTRPELAASIKASTSRFDWGKCVDQYIDYYKEILGLSAIQPSTADDQLPSVSVITVCRNDAAALRTTLDSVSQQDYPHCEHIVVDGASDDDTVHLLQHTDNPRLRWISEIDGGIYEAMNKGVHMASGEWTIFLNAGDTFAATDVLRRIFAQPRTSDILYGDVIKQHKDGTYYVYPAEPVHESHRMFFCHQSSLIRRRLLTMIPYDIGHPYSADYKFFKLMLHHGNTFCQLPFPVAYYDTNGISNRRRTLGLLDNISVIHEIDPFLVRLRLLPRLWFQCIMSKLRTLFHTTPR